MESVHDEHLVQGCKRASEEQLNSNSNPKPKSNPNPDPDHFQNLCNSTGPKSTCSFNFMKIRPYLFELIRSQTNTDENITHSQICGVGKNKASL